MAGRKDYPIYGRSIAAHLARGEKPTSVGVLLSSRWWESFEHVCRMCIKPEDWAPRRYELGFLHGMHVVLVAGDCERRALGELALELMEIRPALLWVFEVDGRALVDGSAPDPEGLAQWAGEMAELPPTDSRLRGASQAYWAGHLAAAKREADEMALIEQRKDLGAAVTWIAQRQGVVERVREQYSLKTVGSGVATPA